MNNEEKKTFTFTANAVINERLDKAFNKLFNEPTYSISMVGNEEPEETEEPNEIEGQADILDLLFYKELFDEDDRYTLYIGETLPEALRKSVVRVLYDSGFNIRIYLLRNEE